MRAPLRWWIRTVPKYARRLIAAVFGGTILIIGAAMLVLPGPGWVVIFIGLGILAIEFAWARRWLKKLKATAGAAGSAVKNGAIGRGWRSGCGGHGAPRPTHPQRPGTPS
jgi:hypothetical protein